MQIRTKAIAGVIVVALTVGAVALSNGSLFQGKSQLKPAQKVSTGITATAMPESEKPGSSAPSAPALQPDLEIVEVATVGSGPFYVGQPIDFTWRIHNKGTATADTGRTINERKSVTGAETRTDLTPNIANASSAISAGGYLSGRSWRLVPANVGSYGVIICADGNGEVAESDENNNCTSIATPITVQGHPDLLVDGIRKTAGTFANETQTIEAEIRNFGNQAVTNVGYSWTVGAGSNVIISNQPGEYPGTIAPSSQGVIRFDIPAFNTASLNPFTSYFVEINVDPNNAITESDEGNNGWEQEIQVQWPIGGIAR